jgi:CRP-like cAMP-binding protein
MRETRCHLDDNWRRGIRDGSELDRPIAARCTDGAANGHAISRISPRRTNLQSCRKTRRALFDPFQIDGANGNRLLLKIVRENELFGEIVAYDGKPAPIAVEARSLLSTDFIPAPQLEQLRGVHPEIDKALATVATQNLRAALAAIDELCLMDLYERAVSCLRRLCTEATESGESATRLDITQTEFASMLGASRQATNKILGQLEREKLLKRNFRNLECNLLFSQRLMHARAE